MNLGQYRVDHLQLQAAVEGLEVIGPPRPHDRIRDGAEHLASKANVRQDRGHLQDRVLRGASSDRIRLAQGDVGVKQAQQRKADPDEGMQLPIGHRTGHNAKDTEQQDLRQRILLGLRPPVIRNVVKYLQQ